MGALAVNGEDFLAAEAELAEKAAVELPAGEAEPPADVAEADGRTEPVSFCIQEGGEAGKGGFECEHIVQFFVTKM
jgi:hypothetical protein